MQHRATFERLKTNLGEITTGSSDCISTPAYSAWTCGEAELYNNRRTDSSIKKRCILEMEGLLQGYSVSPQELYPGVSQMNGFPASTLGLL